MEDGRARRMWTTEAAAFVAGVLAHAAGLGPSSPLRGCVAGPAGRGVAAGMGKGFFPRSGEEAVRRSLTDGRGICKANGESSNPHKTYKPLAANTNKAPYTVFQYTGQILTIEQDYCWFALRLLDTIQTRAAALASTTMLSMAMGVLSPVLGAAGAGAAGAAGLALPMAVQVAV